jgi:hypothetical protein
MAGVPAGGDGEAGWAVIAKVLRDASVCGPGNIRTSRSDGHHFCGFQAIFAIAAV